MERAPQQAAAGNPADASAGHDSLIMSVEGLTKKYAGVAAVDRLSIGFASGSITGIVGPNGAGKTTLFGLISGTVRADEGSISYLEWSFAQEQHLGMAQVITSAGPDPVAITADSVGKTVSGAWFTKQGNDLALDTISFYRPNQTESYPIVLATYEVVCSKYPDAQVGKAVKAFLQSTIGAGQNGLADNGYIPVPQQFTSRLSTAIDAIA